jgi:uncharacterized lipoprotein YmbA
MKTYMAVFLILLCASCTMPETKIYSLVLKNEGEPAKIRTGAAVDILVRSPQYLAQPYIGVRTSPYQLEISRYSKWDSSPVEIVREAFRESISRTRMFREVRASRAVPPDFYALEINLRKFERLDSGEESFAELAFNVRLVSPEGVELYRDSFSKSIPLGRRTFLRLAEVLSAGFSEELGRVQSALAEVLSGKP